MNTVEISNDSLPVVCGCDLLAASEPFFHVDRTADFNILIYVTEGVIYVTEDETDYAVGAGELLILKGGVHHFGKHEIPRGTKWYFIHFTCGGAGGLPNFFPDGSPIPPYTSAQYKLQLPKYLTGLSGSSFERALSSLVDYFHSDDMYKRWRLNLRLFELLGMLALSEFSHKAAPQLSDKVCTYLAEHICEPFSAEKLSREFYLSYKRLAAVFKKEKDVTMQQYHNTLRMNEACRLLRSTLMSVGEISAALGFADMLYFSRCFRAAQGCSPTEYRRKPPMC